MGHHDALWRGLANGMLDTVGTDHCPFTMEQKRMGTRRLHADPERRGRHRGPAAAALHLRRVRRAASTSSAWSSSAAPTPARIFGLFPRKGAVAVGADADLVVYDPEREPARAARRRTIRRPTAACSRLRGQGRAVARGRERAHAIHGRKAQRRARRWAIRHAQGHERRSAPGERARGSEGLGPVIHCFRKQ